MKRKIYHFTIFISILLFCGSIAYTQKPTWPIRQKIDLSSGFGDFRDGRFHAGIDLRTGGRIGRRLISPVDGYIYRLKMSYTGSGKALYLMGDDGYIYVFYHLSSFIEPIDKVIKEAQVKAERYYIDEYLKKDQIRVKEGELIGITGATGTGAPHLHFEKRTKDNIPVNPLTNGYTLSDTLSPVLEQISFELVGGKSLFGDVSRKITRTIKQNSATQYQIENVPFFNAPFGILIDGYDKMRDGGMKQSIYSFKVYLDEKLIYSVNFDSLNFSNNRSVYFEYDLEKVAKGEKHFRRLFHREGNKFNGSIDHNNSDGVIGKDNKLEFGKHNLRIEASDCFSNVSQFKMDFVWGPLDDFYHLDSLQIIKPDTNYFYFTPSASIEKLDIDTVILLLNKKEHWLPLDGVIFDKLENDQLKLYVKSAKIKSKTLMLGGRSKHGPLITTNPFNGIVNKAGKRANLEPVSTPDGLVLKLHTNGNVGSELHINLYYQDELLGTEYPSQFFTTRLYGFFIEPKPEYRMVDEIDVIWSNNPDTKVSHTIKTKLAVVGYNPTEEISFDSLFSVIIGSDNLHKPIWLSFELSEVAMKQRFGVYSDLYSINPEAFVTSSDFKISCRIRSSSKNYVHSGLGWLDEKESRWVWLDDNVFEDQTVHASSRGGGLYGVLLDNEPPEVEFLNLIPGRTVVVDRPVIEVKVVDTLSGIRDDLSFDVRIDKKWMIPEYDPETNILKTQPVEPLSNGEHHLAVIVTDRAGQKTEKYLIFNVNKK